MASLIHITDELRYSLNLPLPPIYDLRNETKSFFQVPEFFGYESPSTRWILAMLTNKSSLKRLIKCGKSHEDIFSRFYQIPDRPVDLMGSDYPLENPAYHHQCVLYLTPLSLALYLKRAYAVEMLLSLKDEAGRKLIHPAEPCFVQKVFRKGDKRMSNELSNSFPIIVAIRRGFYEGVSLLSEFGFTPQKQFSIIHREIYRESVVLYRDVVDYLTELLRVRPGLYVSKFLKIITDPSIGLTTYDIFVFDLELSSNSRWDYVSIFRRVCRVGLNTKFFIEESATQLINILEQIQLMGYFCGMKFMKIYYNGTPPAYFERQLSDTTAKELLNERISIAMDKIPTIVKATRDDLFSLQENELSMRLRFDYQGCVGMLFLWYQRCLYQERTAQYIKLGKLMSKVIVDTNIIKHFFNETDAELAKNITGWSTDVVKESTMFDFRIRMQDYIMFTDFMCINFINKFGEVPHKLIKAHLMQDRHPEDSPIVRELLYVSRSSLHPAQKNQNNFSSSNTSIFNFTNNHDQVTLKFIPANHAKNYSFDADSNVNNFSIFKRPIGAGNDGFVKKSSDFTIRPQTVNNNHVMKSTIKMANSESDIKDNILDDFDNLKDLAEILPPKPLLHKKSISNSSKFSKKTNIYRTKSSNDLRPRRTSSKSNNNLYRASEPMDLRTQLRQLLTVNNKYKDVKLDMDPDNDDFPLQSLREELDKFDSAEFIMHNMQSRLSTRLDNLYNNICADSMINIMQELARKTSLNSPSNLNAALYQVFQNKK